MGDLEVRIRHGSGGIDVAAVAAVAAGLAVVVGALAVAKAVAAIPVWVFAAIPAVLVAGVAVAVVALHRYNRARAADMAALLAARHTREAAAEAARRDHKRAVAAASAPVIHNHVALDRGAIEAMAQGYTPATIFTGQKEIPQ
jgi:hypothetical protein